MSFNESLLKARHVTLKNTLNFVVVLSERITAQFRITYSRYIGSVHFSMYLRLSYFFMNLQYSNLTPACKFFSARLNECIAILFVSASFPCDYFFGSSTTNLPSLFRRTVSRKFFSHLSCSYVLSSAHGPSSISQNFFKYASIAKGNLIMD